MSDIFGKRFLKQKAVYWAPSSTPGDTGRPVYDSPVEIKCRWDENGELFNVVSGNAVQTEVSNAVLLVDRNLKKDGYLWLGSLNQVTDPAVPENNEDVWQIKKFGRTPSPNGKKFLRVVFL